MVPGAPRAECSAGQKQTDCGPDVSVRRQELLLWIRCRQECAAGPEHREPASWSRAAGPKPRSPGHSPSSSETLEWGQGQVCGRNFGDEGLPARLQGAKGALARALRVGVGGGFRAARGRWRWLAHAAAGARTVRPMVSVS